MGDKEIKFETTQGQIIQHLDHGAQSGQKGLVV
jgi:hypothetical protein